VEAEGQRRSRSGLGGRLDQRRAGLDVPGLSFRRDRLCCSFPACRQDITFDFSQAEIRTEDNNADEQETLDNVAVGSPVRVKARLPKGDPGVGPYVAERLDDKSGD
jgi:hypothetical protein